MYQGALVPVFDQDAYLNIRFWFLTRPFVSPAGLRFVFARLRRIFSAEWLRLGIVRLRLFAEFLHV